MKQQILFSLYFTTQSILKLVEQNKIRIFREEGNKTLIFHFRYDDVSTGKKLVQNIWLKRGDVIVVR